MKLGNFGKSRGRLGRLAREQYQPTMRERTPPRPSRNRVYLSSRFTELRIL